MVMTISAKAKMNNDTIVAVSTPHGVGGMAVIRLSGPDAEPLALRHLSVDRLGPRKATYCRFDTLDDIIAIFYPEGYTGEATIEISCHGSLYVQQAILQAFVDEGARLAEPGEFTRRAFINGRIDLSQAEAVADLIDSVTPAQHRLAVSQLRGSYAQTLKQLRQQLLDLTSLLELELDFSQEDVEFADRPQLRQLLATLQSSVSSLLASFRLGNALKRGIPVAIVGKPNAGKSSLLNALLGDNRAIVSDIPGTTRDTIEETFTIDAISFRFIDTAGLHESSDAIEVLGIERSRRAISDAEIILYVHDATIPWQEPELDFKGKHLIVVNNKIDICTESPTISFSQAHSVVNISAKTGMGVEKLKSAMLDVIMQDAQGSLGKEVLLTNTRHYEALQRVIQALDHVSQTMDEGVPTDLLAVDLRDALYYLGTITGEVTSDEILGNIFGRFCIGK